MKSFRIIKRKYDKVKKHYDCDVNLLMCTVPEYYERERNCKTIKETTDFLLKELFDKNKELLNIK